MKRFRLSAKLAMAIIPIGLVAVLAAGFIAYTFLNDSREQSETAHAATVTADAIDTLKAIWDEEGQARQLFVFGDESAADDFASAQERTDEAFTQLRDSVQELESVAGGFFGGVAASIDDDIRAVGVQLSQVRAVEAPTETELAGYQAVANSMLSVLPKASSIVSDRVQARELSTAYFLAEGGQVSLLQEQIIEEFRVFEANASEAEAAAERASLQPTLEVLESEFGAWALRANQTANQMNAAILRYTRLPQVNIDTFPLARNEDILRTSENLAQGVADESQSNAMESETEAYLVAGVAAIVLLLAIIGSYAVIRSVVRRVRGVTSAAVEVSEVDLPNLVQALQNPKEDIADLKPTVIESAGFDEVGDLAQSFTALHSTLIEVAAQQMDILRKGVSDIFVTLARRNRSLVDRQLALLDELESREEDPETLGGYYKLDHLATRMRRNAESLLVLAGSEPTRIWANPLDVSEIIRAALGEVDDYQRVDIMALEPAMISGRAVADIAHLMSELLDNGTQYSSPSDRVRVAGLFDPEGYMLTVSDSGIGMTDARLGELNDLLESPPVLGLALQPTLGMYVVARLAARHGVRVQLISGSPGVTVRVLLPKSLIEAPPARPALTPAISAPEATSHSTDFSPAPSSANGTSSNGVSPATHESQTVFKEERVDTTEHAVEEDEVAATPDEDRPVALPGPIKGKHEHPGRHKVTFSDEEHEVSARHQVGADQDPKWSDVQEPAPAVEAPSEDFATTHEEPRETSPLAKRVPGESLRAEHDPTPVAEATPEVEPIERTDDEDSPWWTKEAAPAEKEPDSSFAFWESDSEDDSAQAEDVGPVDAPVEEPEPRPSLSQAGLPVRTPGVSFKETDESAVSSSASDSGAIGIKSALSSYADGRELAGGKKRDSDRPEGTDDDEPLGGRQ